MIDQASRNKISAWARNEKRVHSLPLLISPHPQGKTFEAFARELTQITPLIRIQPGSHGSGRESDLPGFLIKENIRYSALALDKELTPFLEALSCVQGPWPKPSDEIQALLDQIDLPCHLTLYIAQACPHCPGMVNTLIPLALFCDKIDLQIIDGILFPETALQDRVTSAPCLILDKGFRWIGAVGAREILSMIIGQDPSQMSALTLKTILEKGEADWISRQMVQADRIFEGFVQLLLDRTWSVRLGAMVVVETLGENHPDLASTLGPLLIPAFADIDIPVQGDILYALGETGNLETKAWIEKIIMDLEHPDLKDAAEDAIQAIESRQ